MKQVIKNILNSFDNHSQGYSGRKMTAFWAVLVGTVITYILPESARLHALYSWQLVAMLCLGIITAEQVIKFKNGKKETDEQS